MRTISVEQKVWIEDASNAGLLRDLNPAFLEKDIHVSDALAVIARSGRLTQDAERRGRGRPMVMPIRTRVVFAGGTCLSKAHRVIARMSEDIDLKVELDPIPEGYALPKKLASKKARLKALHHQVQSALEAAGFELVAESDNPKVHAQREYCCMTLQYEPLFNDTLGTLRPHLKLDFVYQETHRPSQPLSVGYLMDLLLNGEADSLATLDCVSVEQTICEKILSLLRRCSEKWEGMEGELDPTLVRHVYDVRAISVGGQPDLEQMKSLFPAIVEVDREDFGNRHPRFRSHPKATLTNALERAQHDEELKTQYDERLSPLVYSQDPHDFDTSFAEFSEIARALIDCLPEVPKLTEPEPLSAPPAALEDGAS